MRRIAIFGNSGSGKSTLARQLCDAEGLAHFDLDTVAWEPGVPPVRRPVEASLKEIQAALADAEGWVIEGCYADLLEPVLAATSEIIFLDLPAEACIANARQRPWEAHKYASKAQQDENLPMLLDWIAQYDSRDDTFSRASHEALFDAYPGRKTRYHSNLRD